jgi:uncharacterized protein YqgC (DUF456 family)
VLGWTLLKQPAPAASPGVTSDVGTAGWIVTSNVLWILAWVLVLVGLAGVVLPALPGPPLIFAGLLLAAWADGFARVGAPTLVVIGVLGAASFAVDFVASAYGAKRGGASARAVAGAAIGTVVGLFFGLAGLILGPLVGAIAGEWTKHRDLSRAGRVGVAAWIGLAVGSAVKIALACSMIAVFLAAFYIF